MLKTIYMVNKVGSKFKTYTCTSIELSTNLQCSLLPNEAHIDLKFPLVGGPNYFCDICDDPVYTCSQCKEVTRAECCNRVRKHSKCSYHSPNQIETHHSIELYVSSLLCASTVSAVSTRNFSDDFPDSPNLDVVLTRAYGNSGSALQSLMER